MLLQTLPKNDYLTDEPILYDLLKLHHFYNNYNSTILSLIKESST
jgi:hypothetical protein